MKKKNREWTDIKELTPLQFMPYVAKLFREVTRQDLSGLGHFTGWIGLGGYYHWRVAQQGLIHLVPHLTGQSMPRTPDARPSGKPLPLKPAQTKTPSMGASGKRPDRSQPVPGGSRQEPTLSQGGRPSTPCQSRTTTAPKAKWKVIHSPPERWTGLLEWKWDPSSLRRSSQPSPREGRSR